MHEMNKSKLNLQGEDICVSGSLDRRREGPFEVPISSLRARGGLPFAAAVKVNVIHFTTLIWGLPSFRPCCLFPLLRARLLAS